MLYDKKWDSQVKPVEPSLKGMIAWLETKDPKEVYEYISNDCAMAQYLKAVGQRKQPCLCWDIGKTLNLPWREVVIFRTSKNFGELLNHLKRLDSQPS